MKKEVVWIAVAFILVVAIAHVGMSNFLMWLFPIDPQSIR